LENLRRVMNDGDGALIEIASPHAAAGFQSYLPVRAACHMKLAEWHTTAPEMVRLYRQQVDGAAQRWLAEALESGQEELLRKLVDQNF